MTPEFALAMISHCCQTANVVMADRLYGHLREKKLSVVSALVRFYAEQGEHEKVCIIYEKDLASASEESSRSPFVDPRWERWSWTAQCGAAARSSQRHFSESHLQTLRSSSP